MSKTPNKINDQQLYKKMCW